MKALLKAFLPPFIFVDRPITNYKLYTHDILSNRSVYGSSLCINTQ